MRVTIVAACGNILPRPSSSANSFPVLSCWHMAETDVERLSRVMLAEFNRVHERFDQVDDNLASLSSEVTAIHRRLATLEETVGNISGFAKEIDHLLTRVAAIERHLGLTAHIKA